MKRNLALLFMLAVPALATATDAVDAARLANSFYSQKAAVVGKYDGKPITVTGTVQKHDHSGNGDSLLLVGSDPTDNYVILRFNKNDVPKAEALKVGARVRADCIGDFKVFPSAKDCHF